MASPSSFSVAQTVQGISTLYHLAEERVASWRHRWLEQQRAMDAHAIVSSADAQGCITYVNDKLCEISGYSREELLGQSHSILNSGVHPLGYFETIWQTIQSGQVWSGLICNRRKDGSLFWLNSTLVPTFDRRGKFVSYMALRTDVTELVQTREQLQQALDEAQAARQQAEQSDRAKSQFLSNMSHELRTPLNAILGFSELLQQENLGAEAKDDLALIHKSGQHLLTLIGEVLDLARIENNRMSLVSEELALGPLLQECERTMQPVAERGGIRLMLADAQGLAASVMADPVRLKQCVLNLISNAIKYNRRNGQVRLSIEARGRVVRITVADTGIGLSAEQLGKLFVPFTRFVPMGVEGTGIGLTITKRLVALMGGKLGVDSRLGEGSTFWIEFQARRLEVPQSRPLGVPVAAPTRDSGSVELFAPATVLYIEDTSSNRLMMQRMFRNAMGVVLHVASTPGEGLAMAETLRPDLILLDIHMPDMDGHEVYQRLRAIPALRHVPVIAISADATVHQIDQARVEGFAQYLTKPVSLGTLKSTMNDYLGAGRQLH